MKNDSIKTISIESTKYPFRLKQIKRPPKKLYYRGNLEILQKKYILAVVGTRLMTSYARQALRYLIPEVARREIVIVSGLARGVDAYAHKLTLENGGKAVVVLAGGLDDIYPPEHTLFAEEIIKAGGLLLSEHSPGTDCLRQYFPARNRIISGISDAVLVVEAKQKSGALITADFAFSQGRKVLAVPGSIFSEQSQGVNGLFQKGAIPVQSPEDLLKILFGWKNKRRIPRNEVNSHKTISLASEEKQILEQVPYDKPAPLNLLIRNANLPAAKVIAVATQLEIKGLIESADGGYIKTLTIS
ncbi:MAG: DNA-processing protein DprA [Candidatus Moraniibacteriota bacterium]